MPKVSVIIPIYKVEEYLSQCLESVLAQDFTELEIIGIDDASPDNSKDIFNKYNKIDARFKLISHHENKGLPASRNTGIKAATGDYLFFLDSDDWISPHAISRLYELAQKDSVDIAIGGTLKYDERTSMVTCGNHRGYMGENFRCKQLYDYPKLVNSVTSWNKMISKEFIFNKNLFFSESPRRFEDMLTYKWYLEGARVSHLSDITYYYRQRASSNASIMQQMDASVLIDKIKAFFDLSNYLIKNNHFLKSYDPLHCKNGIMNLPRSLSWILPQLFSSCPSCPSHQIMCSAVEETRNLFKILPKGYISRLTPAAQKIFFLVESQCHPQQIYSQLKKIA